MVMYLGNLTQYECVGLSTVQGIHIVKVNPGTNLNPLAALAEANYRQLQR